MFKQFVSWSTLQSNEIESESESKTEQTFLSTLFRSSLVSFQSQSDHVWLVFLLFSPFKFVFVLFSSNIALALCRSSFTVLYKFRCLFDSICLDLHFLSFFRSRPATSGHFTSPPTILFLLVFGRLLSTTSFLFPSIVAPSFACFATALSLICRSISSFRQPFSLSYYPALFSICLHFWRTFVLFRVQIDVGYILLVYFQFTLYSVSALLTPYSIIFSFLFIFPEQFCAASKVCLQFSISTSLVLISHFDSYSFIAISFFERRPFPFFLLSSLVALLSHWWPLHSLY